MNPLNLSNRQNNQINRINQGVQHGTLSAAQGTELTQRVDAIASNVQAEKAASPNGHLNLAQWRVAQRQLNHTSGTIFQDKQSGRVQALVNQGSITQDQANTLIGKIDNSAATIRQGGRFGQDVNQLNAQIQAAQQTSQIPLPAFNPAGGAAPTDPSAAVAAAPTDPSAAAAAPPTDPAAAAAPANNAQSSSSDGMSSIMDIFKQLMSVFQSLLGGMGGGGVASLLGGLGK